MFEFLFSLSEVDGKLFICVIIDIDRRRITIIEKQVNSDLIAFFEIVFQRIVIEKRYAADSLQLFEVIVLKRIEIDSFFLFTDVNIFSLDLYVTVGIF